MHPRRLVSFSAAIACAVAVAACGSSSSGGSIELAPSAGATQVSTPTTPTPPPALRTKPVMQVSPSSCATKQLVKKDLVTGSGRVAQAGQSVTVNYVGVLCKTGKEFDSSWKRNQPFTTTLSTSSVIPGWVQGIPGMHVGGRRELIIPPALGYGKAGSPPTIPPNSTLVFVVDLLSIA